jgi:small subunit ribosomal protein S17
VRAPRPPKAEGRRKERRGIVVSAAMDKTITIRIDHAKPHPKYHKIVRRSTRLHAHDERNEAGIGDVVRIVETRPLSKLKRWRMVEIVEKAK